MAQPVVFSQPRRAASIVAMSIFFIGIITSKARFASRPPAASPPERARGDLPEEAPAVLAPTALAFLPAIADCRVPVAVRLFLILRCDLNFAVLELRAAVETETGMPTTVNSTVSTSPSLPPG
jgi:hypothetical protein